MGDAVEAETGALPEIRRLTTKRLSVETNSETLRTMPSPP
jgi:hypothetical protein